MNGQFATFSSVARIDDESMVCRPITVNDRAATREAIIRDLRNSGKVFFDRSSWGALSSKPDIEYDWDYSMIALHHAGRSYSCNVGAYQMLDIQRKHLAVSFRILPTTMASVVMG